MKGKMIAFALVLVALAGCTSTKVVTEGGPRIGRQFTIKTVEVAPADFDAFTFFWMAPAVERFDTQVTWILVLPDGKEQVWDKDLVMSPGQSVRSDVSVGGDFVVADPRQFRNKSMTVIFRSKNGRMRFPSDNAFRFAFYRNGPDGKINWREPYKQIKAITEQK